MNSGFRILEHPSDLGIEAWGPTLSDAFRQSAFGLVSIIVDPATVREREEKRLQVSGSGTDNLLVRWLSELLYLYDGEDFLMANVEITSLNDFSVEAVVRGERLDPVRHQSRLDVKAITYHQLKVTQENGIWAARVFLDI